MLRTSRSRPVLVQVLLSRALRQVHEAKSSRQVNIHMRALCQLKGSQHPSPLSVSLPYTVPWGHTRPLMMCVDAISGCHSAGLVPRLLPFETSGNTCPAQPRHVRVFVVAEFSKLGSSQHCTHFSGKPAQVGVSSPILSNKVVHTFHLCLDCTTPFLTGRLSHDCDSFVSP